VTERLQADQENFQRHLMTGDDTVSASIVGDERAPADTRLAVYYHAYRLRLVEVLQNDFTGVHALLGTDAFREMALAYLAAWPSAQASVRWFGRRLPGFLASGAYAQHPELAEMAHFEWSWAHAFDAADAPVAGLQAMAGIPAESWAELHMTCHPSLARLDLHHNVPALFEAATREAETPPVLTRQDDARGWVLWRRELRVHWRSLEADEAWALDAARAGESFADICTGLCRWHAEDAVPMRGASLLRTWLDEGLLTAVRCPA
jgi:hypothetical protein